MNIKAIFYRLVVSAIFLIYGLCPAMAQESKKFKVLVVMSYNETMPWVKEMKAGIDGILKACELNYFYMDTKNNFDSGDQKAKEAYTLYQEFKPDGVIVADDDAQKMFVVPYLKDKAKTPVMFCGVNADAEKYGYPASNVSGILERHNFEESIVFAQLFAPSIKTFAYMIKESPVGEIVLKQIKSEADTYSAKFIGIRMPKTLKEALSMTEELKEQCDLLVMTTMTGILGDDGKPMSDKEAVPIVVKAFGKAVVGTEEQVVKAGALCSVLRTGQEQGGTAAEMLLKAMNGTPVSQIPITRNHQGKRMINVTAMKELGIKPRPIVLQGAELVKTE
jgi:ABC-type uncharacterized transport system substrate-binding protein